MYFTAIALRQLPGHTHHDLSCHCIPCMYTSCHGLSQLLHDAVPHDSSILIKLQATGCQKGTQGISQPVPQAHNTITRLVPLHTHCNYTPDLAQSYTHYHDPDPVPLYTRSVTYPRPSHIQYTTTHCSMLYLYHVLPCFTHATPCDTQPHLHVNAPVV
jgi:hypothetical protein